MRYKIMAVAVITSALLFLAGAEAWAWRGNRLENRQLRQSERIADGLAKGELARWEYKKLTREQWRIQKAKQRALADGYLDRYEKTRITRMQNRASRHIYRAKHNRAMQRPVRRAWRPYCAPPPRPPVVHPRGYYWRKPCRPCCVAPVRPPVVCPRPVWSGYSFGFGGFISDPAWAFGWSIRLP